MLKAAIPELKKGKYVSSVSVTCDLQEGAIAKSLGEIQTRYATVDIGSYPLSKEHNYHVTIVARSVDSALLAQARIEITKLIKKLGGIVISEEY